MSYPLDISSWRHDYPSVYQTYLEFCRWSNTFENNIIKDYTTLRNIEEFHPVHFNRNISDDIREEYRNWLTEFLLPFQFSYNSYILSLEPEPEITTDVKVVKKDYRVHCLTISPPVPVDCESLYKLSSQIVKLSGCQDYIGVYELGRKSGNFHTHILLKTNNKNFVQNVKKKIYKQKMNYKVDINLSPVQILQTLRYFWKPEKLNCGVIHQSSLDNFLAISSLGSDVFMKNKCETKEYKEKIWNLD